MIDEELAKELSDTLHLLARQLTRIADHLDCPRPRSDRQRVFEVGDEVRVRPGQHCFAGELGRVEDARDGVCLVGFAAPAGAAAWLNYDHLERETLR